MARLMYVRTGGHRDVEKGDHRPLRLDRSECRHAVSCSSDNPKSVLGEETRHHLDDRRVVVGHEARDVGGGQVVFHDRRHCSFDTDLSVAHLTRARYRSVSSS
jgi:hypothetical protein